MGAVVALLQKDVPSYEVWAGLWCLWPGQVGLERASGQGPPGWGQQPLRLIRCKGVSRRGPRNPSFRAAGLGLGLPERRQESGW